MCQKVYYKLMKNGKFFRLQKVALTFSQCVLHEKILAIEAVAMKVEKENVSEG